MVLIREISQKFLDGNAGVFMTAAIVENPLKALGLCCSQEITRTNPFTKSYTILKYNHIIKGFEIRRAKNNVINRKL